MKIFSFKRKLYGYGLDASPKELCICAFLWGELSFDQTSLQAQDHTGCISPVSPDVGLGDIYEVTSGKDVVFPHAGNISEIESIRLPGLAMMAESVFHRPSNPEGNNRNLLFGGNVFQVQRGKICNFRAADRE